MFLPLLPVLELGLIGEGRPRGREPRRLHLRLYPALMRLLALLSAEVLTVKVEPSE